MKIAEVKVWLVEGVKYNWTMIKIYTDGSCLENPGNGGWAAIISKNGKNKEIITESAF